MMKRSLQLTFVLGLLGSVALGDVVPASLFQDHMVLQREMPVPVWGTADTDTTVTVEFAGQKKTAPVDASGKWKVTLDAMPASFDAAVMTISANDSDAKFTISDVVIGEVWICSGQSNMQLVAGIVPEIKALIPSAKNIRNFTVKNTVALTEQDHCEGTWETRYPNSAIAFGFAYFLQEAAEVPVGIILTAWGSSSIEAWMPRDMTETVPHFKTMMDEFDADTVTQDKIKAILAGPQPWSKGDDVFLRRQSNVLYNAMMHPLVPYACRGLVWYQGERNTQSMFGMIEDPWFSRNSGMLKYGDTLKQWITRYRQEWSNDEMHFLAVMLPGYHTRPLTTGPQLGAEHPASHSWAWMREQQLKALELPNVSVANSIDTGDLKNIHPRDKLPICQRLALLAARDTLGQKIEAQGPVMKTVKAEKNALIVQFDHADGLKTKDGAAPTAFWLADDSKQWKPAEASIKGTTVVLTSAELDKPLYVRYAFAGMPKVNLINSAALPAYPFRTDRFEP
jgi:sialate O-acetylesterase